MADGGGQDERLEEIMGRLVARRMEESLARVEEALAAWRRGDKDLFATHAEVMRHAARTGALSARVARAAIEGPERLLRDAFDAGLVAREEFVEIAGKPPEDVLPSPSLESEAAQNAGAGPPMPDKRAVFDKLITDGPVLLHLDARRSGVRVPAAHQEDPRLVLRFGLRLTPPIHDLVSDERGVRATLTFRGVPFACVVPWPSVYAVVAEDGRGLIWPDDVPPEAARDLARAPKDRGSRDEPEPPTSPRKGGHLKLV